VVLAVGSVLLAVASVFAGAVLAQDVLRATVLGSMASEGHLAACRAAPATWGVNTGRFSLYAYDSNGISLNPNAPPLDPNDLSAVGSTGQAVRHIAPDGLITGVLPFGGDGPCALLRVTSDPLRPGGLRSPLLILAGCAFVGAILAAFAAWTLVVFPMRRRIQLLSRAAEGVGAVQFTRPEAGSDDLGRIGWVLGQSHDRIVETRLALEARNRALEEHFASIAHDLRTPLASMQLALEALAGEAEGGLRQEARRGLAEVVYLSSLVDNLHHGARLRHEVSVTEGTVDLVDLLLRLERRFAVVGRHAEVEVAISVPDHPVLVACAPALAERAIANLLQNAVEHNGRDGHAAVLLTARDLDFELIVVDDGPGLPPDLHASLEAETFRTDQARRPGPGLGMLITAEIARRACWTVRYEPNEPTGLRVTLHGRVKAASSA
jgi:signal transduction histidine kinase